MFRGGRIWSLFVACVGVLLTFGSLATLNVALTDIGADTGAGQTALTWVLDAYTLVLACLLLPFGAVGDRLGRRAMLVAGAGVFGVGSLIPIDSDSVGAVITARAVSGAGAAMLLPATLAIITASCPSGERGRAVGVWAATAAVAGTSGVVVGGVLLEAGSWRTIFVVTAVANAAFAALSLTIDAPEVEHPPRVDLIGAVLSAAAVALTVTGILQAPEHGWFSVPVIGLWLAGAVGGVAFCRHQLRVREPLLDIRLFRDRLVAAASLSLTLQFATGFGMLFYMLQFLQLVRDMGAVQAGVALGPLGGPIIVVSLLAPLLIRRFGFGAVAGAGFACMGAGSLLWTQLEASDGYAATLPTLMLTGLGLGLTAGPSTVGVVDAIPVAKQGVASAINDTTREIGAAIGIAMAGSLLATGYRDHVGAALARLPGPVAERIAGSPASLPETLRAYPAARDVVPAVRDAFMHGQQSAAAALAVLALAGAVLVPVIAPRRRRGRNEPCPTSSSANPSERRSAPSSAPSPG